MNNPNTVIESIFNNSVIARFYNLSLRALPRLCPPLARHTECANIFNNSVIASE